MATLAVSAQHRHGGGVRCEVCTWGIVVAYCGWIHATVQKTWDTLALAAMGKHSMIQGQLRRGACDILGKSVQANWENDIEAVVAQYYLMFIPGMCSLQVFGSAFAVCVCVCGH